MTAADGCAGVSTTCPLAPSIAGALRILPKWLKRRGQRPSYAWQGFTAIAEICTAERPWIVEHPKTRRTTVMTGAGVRKRVLLKSPVRENRTPGSVRGPSGNWRFHRDDFSGYKLRDFQHIVERYTILQ